MTDFYLVGFRVDGVMVTASQITLTMNAPHDVEAVYSTTPPSNLLPIIIIGAVVAAILLIKR